MVAFVAVVALFAVLLIQGTLAIRLARRKPHWSRRRISFVAAAIVPFLCAVLEIPAVVVPFTDKFGGLAIVVVIVTVLLVVAMTWLIGAGAVWATLAWKKLPGSSTDVANTFK